ncbi:MAG TPA: hypothetical protein VG798_08495 [Rhizomicrobium sp.]|nr:hypothetical protein [Rhizomicrobium sp.]
MRKILAMISTVLVAGWALPAQAQAVQTPQDGPNSPPLKCGDFKHNSDGSWAPAHEVTILFPDGTTLGVAPNATFPATGSWMGLPLAQLLNAQCASK